MIRTFTQVKLSQPNLRCKFCGVIEIDLKYFEVRQSLPDEQLSEQRNAAMAPSAVLHYGILDSRMKTSCIRGEW